LHPTHSVAAIGRSAAELVADHEIAKTPCGLGTPYARLLDAGGQILLLGVSLKRNTCFHTVESLAGVPYLIKEQPDEFMITGYDGETSHVRVCMHAPAVPSRFTEMRNLLHDECALTEERVGKATSMLIDGPAFRDALVPTITKDPTFLLRTS
jgi:aminoglycoside 3-N-acetyltransferase